MTLAVLGHEVLLPTLLTPPASLQEQPLAKKGKHLSNLTENMLKGSPFPRLHAKAVETKGLVQAVSIALRHFRDQNPEQQKVLDDMVTVLDLSHSIDVLIDAMEGFSVPPEQGHQLVSLVQRMNVGITKLCHTFHQQGVFLFNFVPKNHYLFHLAELGQHMSPKLAWCYMGEDLMYKVKVMAQGSFRGTAPRKLGNKILKKYLLGLSHALSPA